MLSDEQIWELSKPFISEIGGDHWNSGDDGIRDNGKIEEFARAIEAATRAEMLSRDARLAETETPEPLSDAEFEALVRKHGATSYRNRADTQHPSYGFSEAGLRALIEDVQCDDFPGAWDDFVGAISRHRARQAEAAATAEARALVKLLVIALEHESRGEPRDYTADAIAATRQWLGEAQKGDGHG